MVIMHWRIKTWGNTENEQSPSGQCFYRGFCSVRYREEGLERIRDTRVDFGELELWFSLELSYTWSMLFLLKW